MSQASQLLAQVQALQPAQFEALALRIFRYQAQHCSPYAQWLQALGRQASQVQALVDIPFLPISVFKHRVVLSSEYDEVACTEYASSGTTGQQRSRHFIPYNQAYLQHAAQLFQQQYGPLAGWAIFALLPDYQQRGGSSLVAMVQHFLQHSSPGVGGFFQDLNSLTQHLNAALSHGQRVLLLGVSHALLRLAALGPQPWQRLLVMETGGMKGHGPELTKQELHQRLQQAWGCSSIHSEYGMTELMSQAYSTGQGRFVLPTCMAAVVRSQHDPFEHLPPGRRGGLNLIDLANVHSCSFIETEDLAMVHSDGTFSILGRLDNSEVRGCNLLFHPDQIA